MLWWLSFFNTAWLNSSRFSASIKQIGQLSYDCLKQHCLFIVRDDKPSLQSSSLFLFNGLSYQYKTNILTDNQSYRGRGNPFFLLIMLWIIAFRREMILSLFQEEPHKKVLLTAGVESKGESFGSTSLPRKHVSRRCNSEDFHKDYSERLP